MDGNWFGYPTYVLQAGAFLAGAKLRKIEKSVKIPLTFPILAFKGRAPKGFAGLV